jgi:hypothetical protein
MREHGLRGEQRDGLAEDLVDRVGVGDGFADIDRFGNFIGQFRPGLGLLRF